MRRLYVFFLAACFGLFAVPMGILPAVAQDSDDMAVYKITDVVADVTADNATHARDQAIIQAQRTGYQQLLSRLGVDPAIAARQSDDVIATLVQGFQIQQERTSAVRYIGTFTIQYKPNAVRSQLGSGNISFNETRSRPVVVLPVVAFGGRSILWEDTTKWRAAWDAAARDPGLVPIVVPQGDLDDISLLNTADAVSGKASSLQAIIAKYKGGGAIVATLNADPDHPDPKGELRVDAVRYDVAGKAGNPIRLSLPAPTDATMAGEITDAVKQLHAQLETDWRQSAKAPKGPATHLQVMAPIQTLADWAAIKIRLGSIPEIAKINVIALSRGEADIELEFHGDIPQLQSLLAEQKLALGQSPVNGGWVLHDLSTGN